MTVYSTARLRVREWQEADFPVLRSILGDPLTMAHWPEPLNEAQARHWFEASREGMRTEGAGRWCCELKSTGEIVGDVGIVVKPMRGEVVRDIGYIIHYPYWRNGYAYEASMGAIEWAGRQGYVDLVATMATDNLPSASLAAKLGMQLEDEFVNSDNCDKPTFWYRLKL